MFDEVMFKSTLGGHHVRLGKPRPCKAKQPYEDLPYLLDLAYVTVMVAACSERETSRTRV